MELDVLDTNFNRVDVLDTFDSLIWTDRYYKCGDFEIYVKANISLLNLLRTDYYLCLKESEHTMIIEDCPIKYDSEKGDYLIITGRSLESILDRRIIKKRITMGKGTLYQNVQVAIQLLMNSNIAYNDYLKMTAPNRMIDNLIFEMSNDPNITSLAFDDSYTIEMGQNLYDVIQNICELKNIGFKITLTDSNVFKFKLYSGADRSYNQATNPYLVFSPQNDNIIDDTYIESKKTSKTACLVAGEGEGNARKMVDVGSGEGLSRREMFLDAKDVTTGADDETLTPLEYTSLLLMKGVTTLMKNGPIKSFEGQLDASNITYVVDFLLGDVVQVENSYGAEAKSRIIEVTHSQSETGVEIYPTFSAFG